MVLLTGLCVIALAVVAVLHKIDVRFVMLTTALLLGGIAGDIPVILREFFSTFSQEQFAIPIGTAIGFAYVLRQTGCDQHLVHLLVHPLQRARSFLIPGTIIVGFLVNIPVISQVGTAVSIGAVLIPLLRAAKISPVTIGAALLLGCSVGGDLLNPGAPEWRTVTSVLPTIYPSDCVARVLPLLILQVCVATVVFWGLSVRSEAIYRKEISKELSRDHDTKTYVGHDAKAHVFRVNPIKAIIPLVPLVLLFLTGPPLQLWTVPRSWLVNVNTADHVNYNCRLIGLAMMSGVALAGCSDPKTTLNTARSFFEGVGYAFTHSLSLIVSATCFGKGVRQIGVNILLGQVVTCLPNLLLPIAGVLPLSFAVLCGSGMASTQSLFEFFVDPAQQLNMDPLHVGTVVTIAAASGRTMSPAAAVALMCAALTNTDALQLVRRVFVPLLMGLGVVVTFACLGLGKG